ASRQESGWSLSSCCSFQPCPLRSNNVVCQFKRFRHMTDFSFSEGFTRLLGFRHPMPFRAAFSLPAGIGYQHRHIAIVTMNQVLTQGVTKAMELAQHLAVRGDQLNL